MPQTPSLASDRFALTLDGTVCGFLASAEGGDISAPVIREPAGAFTRKRLGAPAPEPIVLSFDLSLVKIIYEWIAEFWQGNASTKSGSLIAVDVDNQARSELVFEKASIVATTVPAMDTASKAPCRLAVRLNPVTTSRRPSSGRIADPRPAPKKPWLPSNFRFEIDGLDTTRVRKIEALTVARGEDGAIDFPDVRVLLAETTSPTWSDWHDEFVVNGKNDDSNEKSGSLVFLAGDQRTRLGSVTLSGLGIYRLTGEPIPQRAAAAQVTRLVAELYCERMELAVE